MLSRRSTEHLPKQYLCSRRQTSFRIKYLLHLCMHIYVHIQNVYTWHTHNQHAQQIKQMPPQPKPTVVWKYCNYPPSKSPSYLPLRALKQKHSKSWLPEHKVTTTNFFLHLLALQSCFDTLSLKSRSSPVFAHSGYANKPLAISGLNRLILVPLYSFHLGILIKEESQILRKTKIIFHNRKRSYL